MSEKKGVERVKRAARMLIDGATLLGQPCPYCGGVRVLKDGNALCVSCGQEPEERDVPATSLMTTAVESETGAKDGRSDGKRHDGDDDIIQKLEKKLLVLADELAAETDRQKEIGILDSMEAVMSTIEKARVSGQASSSASSASASPSPGKGI